MVERLPSKFKVLGVGCPELKETILSDCPGSHLCLATQFMLVGLMTFGDFSHFFLVPCWFHHLGQLPEGWEHSPLIPVTALLPCS